MEKLFLTIFNMSLTASIILLVTMLIRVFLKKAPRWISCVLWGMVAFRLICPFSLESVFSLVPSAEPIPQEIMVMDEPQLSTGIPVVNQAINPIITQHFAPSMVETVNPMQITVFIASKVWLIGALILFGYAVISYFLLYKKVRGSISFEGRVKLCDYIESPFILGILNPYIYVPSGLPEEQCVHVIAHEKAHLKRLDHLWKPLGFLILTIHWFNPLVWVAYILLCKDIEIACDEKVIRDMERANATSYAQTLLECSQERRFILMCPLAFGEVSVKERIKHVLNFKKPAFWVIMVALVSCIVIAVCFLTNPKKEANSIEINEGTNVEIGQTNEVENDISGNEQADAQEIESQEKVDSDTETNDLGVAIKQVVLKHGAEYAPSATSSKYKVASFIELGRITTDGTIEEFWLYGVAMYMEANASETGIEVGSSSHVPVVLGFKVVDEKYVLTEYWEPGEGAYYAESIREKFPDDIVEQAIDTQATVKQQTIDCYDQIIRQSGMNPDVVIGKLLDRICSGDTSSGTSDYIKAWPIEYRELIYYGRYTLNYKNQYFNGKQDLKAAVLEEACKQIQESIGSQIVFEGTIVENMIESLVPVILVEKYPSDNPIIPYDKVMFELPKEMAFWEEKVGTRVRIVCHDSFLESMPAQGDIISIEEVTTKRVHPITNEEITQMNETVPAEQSNEVIKCVMVNGELYFCTGAKSTIKGRCGNMDGDITGECPSDEYPTQNNQGNFGKGYGFQYGPHEGMIEVKLEDGEWYVFATEKVLASSEMMVTNLEMVSFFPADIHSIVQIDVVLTNGEMHCVTDGNVLKKIESMLSEASEIKEAGCPFHTPMYIYRADGTAGVIYPATDSCDIFYSDGRYYDYGSSDNSEFWSALGVEVDGGIVFKIEGNN